MKTLAITILVLLFGIGSVMAEPCSTLWVMWQVSSGNPGGVTYQDAFETKAVCQEVSKQRNKVTPTDTTHICTPIGVSHPVQSIR